MSYVDLFGNVVEENLILTEKYIEPPFSVLDGRSQRWQQRKQKWKQMGLKSEEGRDAKAYELAKKLKEAGFAIVDYSNSTATVSKTSIVKRGTKESDELLLSTVGVGKVEKGDEEEGIDYSIIVGKDYEGDSKDNKENK